MKILGKDLKRGQVKLKIENPEDLWYLSHLVESGDLVRGTTIRKIKLGGEEERKARIRKRKVSLAVRAEKVDFSPESEKLKVLGVIEDGPEDVQRGSHHSFNLERGTVITLVKERWLNYQLDKLKEAATTKTPRVLLCILDRERAFFARLKRSNYQILSKIEGAVEKKGEQHQAKGDFYGQVIGQLREYDQRFKLVSIVIASPAFFKEDLVNQLQDQELKKKVVQATCSSVTETAFREVLKRPEVRQVLKQDRISKEMSEVDELLQEISKSGRAVYGLGHTRTAVEMGAVQHLLVTDAFLQQMKEKGKYQEMDTLMKSTEEKKGSVSIINSEHQGGQSLDGLGGVGAILRFQVNF